MTVDGYLSRFNSSSKFQVLSLLYLTLSTDRGASTFLKVGCPLCTDHLAQFQTITVLKSTRCRNTDMVFCY